MTQKRKARSLFAALLAVLLLAALPLSAYATVAPAADGSLTVALDNYNSFNAAVLALSNPPDLATVTTLTITGSFNGGKAWDAHDGAILAAEFPNLDTLNMGSYSGTYGNNAFNPSIVGEMSPLEMRRIRLPADATLPTSMFYNCSNLTTLVCGNGDWQDGVINLTGAGGYGQSAFGLCTAITQVRLPAGIAIPTVMFGGCASLKTLVCGDGAPEQGVIDLTGYTGRTYGGSSFQACSAIEQVRLPDNIAIPAYMFSKCTSLKGLTFVGSSPTAPSVGTNAFNDVSSNGTLTYPAGATGYDTFGAPALDGWTRVAVDPPAPAAPSEPAAEGTPHVCDFGNWQYSNEHHWKRCSCMALSDYAPHVFNSARVCTVCGYGARPKKVNPPTGVYDSYMLRFA